jgi:hypothetical protein
LIQINPASAVMNIRWSVPAGRAAEPGFWGLP